ncbi:MAG TPA: Fic family protein [Opitutaceae bacterium]|nr:Fic family protein [Opitutaceae bacterium]
MPSPLNHADYDKILAVCATLPQPIALEAICSQLGEGLSRRSIQRRLKHLVAQGKLIAQSNSGGRRYRLPEVAAPAAVVPSVTAPAAVAAAAAPRATVGYVPTGYVPDLSSHPFSVNEPPAIYGTGFVCSAVAEELRLAVARPYAERRPVGYNVAFLEAYRPNESAYLLPAQRERLAALGRSPGGPQPAGTYFRKILDRLLIDLSWNSSRLEGNTYSFLETERLLRLSIEADGRATEETLMILNHKAAIELLADQPEELGFNRYTLCNLHALLGQNIIRDDLIGRLRDEAVGIAGSVFQPLDGPPLIEEQFRVLLAKAEAIADPFEQAFFAMVHLPYLQPFADANKRVSRLAANLPLLRHNLCPLSFVDMPQDDYLKATLAVYELNRIEYLREVFVWSYERSCARYAAVSARLGAPDPFRVQHRAAIGELVAGVVRQRLDKAAAVKWIAAQAAARVAAEERPRLAAAVEAELCALHEGSILRFHLRPSEYHAWKLVWA